MRYFVFLIVAAFVGCSKGSSNYATKADLESEKQQRMAADEKLLEYSDKLVGRIDSHGERINSLEQCSKDAQSEHQRLKASLDTFSSGVEARLKGFASKTDLTNAVASQSTTTAAAVESRVMEGVQDRIHQLESTTLGRYQVRYRSEKELWLLDRETNRSYRWIKTPAGVELQWLDWVKYCRCGHCSTWIAINEAKAPPGLPRMVQGEPLPPPPPVSTKI